MYSKFIPKNIQEKLKAKERALSWKESNANEPVIKGTIKPQDIQSRSTFVRMCSNKVDSVTNILISGGKNNPQANTSRGPGKTMRHGLDVEKDYGSEFGTFLYDQTLRYGIRPIAGIKNIEVGYMGSYKAIREATVNWTVGSLEELDKLTPYFLTLGKTIIVDWGWVNPNVKSFTQMFGEGSDPFITFQEENVNFDNPEADVNANFKVNQEIFTNAQVRIQKIGGDYDAIGGKVSNFEMTMRDDGGFDCVTKITALGSALFSKPIDKPTDQITAIGIGSTKDLKVGVLQDGIVKGGSDVKAAGSNDNLINALINLKTIIVKKVFGYDYKGNAVPILKEGSRNMNTVINKGKIHSHPGSSGGTKSFTIIVDNKSSPQVCWMSVYGEQKFFVKWGWMEDQLMNTYLAYDAGEGEGAGLKISFRSIKTKLDKDGEPIENDIYKVNAEKQNTESTDSTYTPDNNKGHSNYPFLRVNWSNPYSEEKRESLAKKYGYDTYDEYKAKPGNDLSKRKQDWDNSPELWNVTTIIEPPVEAIKYDDEYLRNLQNNTYDETRQGSDSTVSEASTRTVTEESVEDVSVDLSEDTSLNMSYFTDNPIPWKDNIPVAHMNEYEKESTIIRNKPKEYFKPISLFRFWSTELLPDIERITGGNFGSDYEEIPVKDWYRAWKNAYPFKREQFTIDKERGILRNMWVDVEEIQKAFGISNSSADKITANPPGTFEQGIKALLKSLNNNFYNIWDFELAVDPYDSTNIGVVDRKVASLDKESLKYTRYKTDVVDGEGKTVEDKEGNSTHQIQSTGIYKFPSFKVGSIVKSQNLNFKIPSSLDTTIVYGSNKEVKGADNQNNFNNPELMKIFNSDSSIEYDDKFLKGMMTANIDKSSPSGSAPQNIGSFKTNPNSKLVKGQGVNINPEEPGYKTWTGNKNGQIDSPKTGTSFAKSKFVFSKEGDVIRLTEKTVPTPLGGWVADMVTDETRGIYEVRNKKPRLYLYKDYNKDGPNPRDIRIYDDVAKLIRSRVNGTIETENEKELSSQLDPIIPAELTLEVDGIGGLVPGDIIHTDYIQEKYRVEIQDSEKNYGPYTYFMIKGVNQKVSPGTWATELITVMKLNRVPLKDGLSLDREPVDQIIEDAPIRPSIPVPTDDEDIADDVTLDDLDFDTFEKWDAPPLPEPKVEKKDYELGIGHGIPNLDPETGKVNISRLLYDAGVARRSTHDEVEEFTTDPIKIGGFPIRPSIPVPTDDEDIVELSPEEIKELQDYNPEFEEFTNWTVPPPKTEPSVIINKKKQEIEFGDAVKQKNPKGAGRRESTYRGHYWQNDKYLYSGESYGRPNWRPIFEFANGDQFHFDKFTDPNHTRYGEEAVKTIRKELSFNERKSYWDREIEGKTTRIVNGIGVSVLDRSGGDRRAGYLGEGNSR